MFYRVFAPRIISENLSFHRICCVDNKGTDDRITDVTSKQHNEQRNAKMTIKIIRKAGTDVFTNMVDADKFRRLLDECGIDYRVEWDCK